LIRFDGELSLELLLNFIGSVLEVMLQKLVEAEKIWKRSKDLFNEFQPPLTAPFQVFNLSFSKCIISYPFIVRLAVLKYLNPIPGLTSHNKSVVLLNPIIQVLVLA